MTEHGRVLIAGVGYTNLRDLSLGPVLVPELQQIDWHDRVEVEDLSIGPIYIVQRLEDMPHYFARIILFGAVGRGRVPGRIYSYRWSGKLPPPEQIQSRIGEAVMGVISLDNLLIIGSHFRVFPPDVIVVEIEPQDEDWGLEFSDPVRAAIPDLIRTLQRAALDPAFEVQRNELYG